MKPPAWWTSCFLSFVPNLGFNFRHVKATIISVLYGTPRGGKAAKTKMGGERLKYFCLQNSLIYQEKLHQPPQNRPAANKNLQDKKIIYFTTLKEPRQPYYSRADIIKSQNLPILQRILMHIKSTRRAKIPVRGEMTSSHIWDESSHTFPETQHKQGNTQDVEADHSRHSDHTKRGNLTTDEHVSFGKSLMVDFLLCDHTADTAGVGHIGEGLNVITAVSLCDRWIPSRKDVSSAVFPLNLRFWRSAFNLTLQQSHVCCLINCCDVRLWRRTCIHNINKAQ